MSIVGAIYSSFCWLEAISGCSFLSLASGLES